MARAGAKRGFAAVSPPVPARGPGSGAALGRPSGPDRLCGVSIGAPGRVTLIDPDREWWLGTKGFEQRFGATLRLADIRKVPVHMVVGAEDTETWEINNPGDSNWMDGADAVGRTRVERITALRDNYTELGIDVTLDIVLGVGHRGMGVLDAVRRFAERVLPRVV